MLNGGYARLMIKWSILITVASKSMKAQVLDTSMHIQPKQPDGLCMALVAALILVHLLGMEKRFSQMQLRQLEANMEPREVRMSAETCELDSITTVSITPGIGLSPWD
jgi:hypothetical protein